MKAPQEQEKNRASFAAIKACAPWTWRIALRDHGPRDVRFIVAMLTLATYMDRDGVAWPSLRTWARGARMNRRTLSKIVETAVAWGWLGVAERQRSGHAWRGKIYRCVVPDDLHLDVVHEELANVYASQLGDPEDGPEAGAPRMHHVSNEAGAPIDAPRSKSANGQNAEGGALRPPDVVHFDAEAGALSRQGGAPRVYLNSSSELSKKNSSSEAHANARAPTDFPRKSLRPEGPDRQVADAVTLTNAERMAAEIRFRERRKGETPAAYAVAVVVAKAGIGKVPAP